MMKKLKNIMKSNKSGLVDMFNILGKENCSISMSSGNSIQINGVSCKGNNISVNGNKIYIDGKLQEDSQTSEKVINIIIQGDCENIISDNCDIEIVGNALSVSSTNGDITCHDVSGNVTSQNGDIDVSGSINGDCYSRNGDISKRFR